MKITLSIDSDETIEINHSDLADIARQLDDDDRHAAFFSRLAIHPASEVRNAVAFKSSLSFRMLERLARDASIEVVREVANTERAMQMFDLPLILEMINRDVSVALAIADNFSSLRESMRDEVIDALSKHADPKVVNAAENLSQETW